MMKSKLGKKKPNIVLPPAPVCSLPMLPPIVTHVYSAPYNSLPYNVRLTPDLNSYLCGNSPPLPLLGDLQDKYTWPNEDSVYFTDIPLSSVQKPTTANEPREDKVSVYI